jgi:hypothetical protein
MALNEPDHRLFVVTRLSARLMVLDTDSGKIVQTLLPVGDCDDVFFDSVRKGIYAIGGEGAISVFPQDDPNHYSDVGRIPTVKGARTGFFTPELDRLFVAVRRQGSTGAVGGGFVSLHEGIRHLRDPRSLEHLTRSYAILAISAICEGYSLSVAYREFRATSGDHRL